MKNDAELIQRTLAGDNNAFSELVKKYRKQVHALAWRKIGDFHTAEDITQDTFLKAYQRLHTLKEPQRFAGWLYVIATRRCLAWFRKKRLWHQTLENIDTPVTSKDAYSQHVAEEQAKTTDKAQQEVVKKLLETLKESDRTVITLHYFGEMTCEQMSEFLGVSANTIKSRLRRARNRLKKEEPMIREAISNFQISPNLTDNIMQEINRLKPAAPSASKPLVPWVIGAASTVLIVLMLGISSQDLARFQRPYSLDAQSEMAVELIDAPVVQSADARQDVRNQLGERSDTEGKNNGDGEKANQVLGDEGDYTRWNLPKGAKQRLGKGTITDMQLSPDGTRLAIVSSTGVWLYDIGLGAETSLLTRDTDLIGLVTFSPDGKKLVSVGGDNIIRSWDVESGKLLLKFNSLGDSLSALKFLADGKTLTGVNKNSTVWFWNIATGEHLKTFHPGALKRIKIKGIPWTRALDVFVDPTGVVKYAIGNEDGTISMQDGRSIQDGGTSQEIQTLVARTNDAAFIKDARIPPDPEEKDGKKPFLTNYSEDGTLFPIQYNLQEYSPLPLDKQPVKRVNELKFSPDGKMLVSKSHYRIPIPDGWTRFAGPNGWARFAGPIEIWNVDTGEQLAALPEYVDVRFSGDSKTLALISRNTFTRGSCAVWDIVNKRQIAEFQSTSDVKFSDDGKTLNIRKGGSYDRNGNIIERASYKIWDIVTQSEIASLTLDEDLFVVLPKNHLFSQDGKILVTENQIGTVDVWEIKKDTQPRTLAKDYAKEITTLAFTHDGKTLASGSDGNIQLWDTDSGDKLTAISTGKNNIDGLTFASDNNILNAVGLTSTVQWDVTTGTRISANTVPMNLARAQGLAVSWDDGTTHTFPIYVYSPNFRTLATKNENNNNNNKIELWNVTSREHLCSLTEKAYQSAKGAMALTHDGSMLATDNRSGKVFLWDTHADKRIATLNTTENLIKKVLGVLKNRTLTLERHGIYSMTFDHNGKNLAIGIRDREIQLWDVAAKKRVRTFKAPHKFAICKLAFSSDGILLASGDIGGKIHLWESTTGAHLTSYEGHKGNISALVFSKDRKLLASTSSLDGTVLLWNVPSK
ncbi:sigma-70 family RNA polymerase sigma factor [Candidatus Poribacteria bacterium]|nr:sigma-70 family RNA polymerase sigma factor [Candidatus Poribacteria bacterium]